MYLRTRPCLRQGKVPDLFTTKVLRPSPGYEFLYPRWFTQDAIATSLPEETEHSAPLGDIEITSPRDEPKVDLANGPRLPFNSRSLDSQVRTAKERYENAKVGIEQLRNELRDIGNVILKRRNVERYLRLRERRKTHGRGSESHSHAKLAVRRIPTSEREDERHRKLRKTMVRAMADPRNMVWTDPARILSNAVQRAIPRKGHSIHLHERTVIFLTGSQQENIWIHDSQGVHGGCEIQVCARAPGSTAQRELILRGSESAVSLTKEYLYAEEQSLLGSRASNLKEVADSDDTSVDFQYVAIDHVDFSHTPPILRAHPPIPDQWSVRAFAQYVNDICNLAPTPALQREYQLVKEESFQEMKVNELEALFTNRTLEPYFSSYAFALAIEFVCKHTQFRKAKDLLYEKARSCGLHRRTWLYNILIENALRMNRLDQLRAIVEDMRSDGIEPDGVTWSKLLLVTKSISARRHILDFIFHAYPDDFASMHQEIADRIIQQEMVSVVQGTSGFRSFKGRMDKGFGPGWLTSRTLNQVLITSGQKKLWKAADEVLSLAAERELQLQPKNISALFYLNKRRRDLNKVVDLLQLRDVLNGGLRGSLTRGIPLAFCTAWDKQRYNMCRVIWQYAASHGLINGIMRSRVSKSLRQAQPARVLNRWMFPDLAGKIIIGTDLDTTGFDEQFPRLSKYFSTTKNPLQWLSQQVPDDATREEQLSLAYVLVGRDIDAWKTLKPMSSDQFCELLNTAKRRDDAWASEKFTEHATLAEMLSHAIHVTVVQRRTALRLNEDVSGSPSHHITEMHHEPSTATIWTPLMDAQFAKLTSWAVTTLNPLFRQPMLTGSTNSELLPQERWTWSVDIFHAFRQFIIGRTGTAAVSVAVAG